MTIKPTPKSFHPAKVLKYCPFCGAATFEWEGEKNFHCSTCKHRYYINQAAAVVAIIKNAQNELLLTRRKFDPQKGMLDLPGGFVDLGETAESAVKREVKEELNLNVESIDFFGSFPNQYVFGGITYFTLDMAFICNVSDFSGILAADDVTEFVFTPAKEVCLENIGLTSIREVVRSYRENHT